MNDAPDPDRTRWQKLGAMVDALITLDPARREAWLDERAVDGATRRLLGEMLDAAQHTGPLVAALDSPAIGTFIADYELVELIGAGGMATVYRAERRRDGVTQRLALKLMRQGIYERPQQEAFRREQRVLVRLEHPHIARLVDGGLTAAGVPYFVMEYVEGQVLDRYVRETKPTTRQLLELFAQICAAVAYAHRNLVVHRDLKPSNILVKQTGEIKLLDFGIAKLLDEPADATRPEHRMATLGYAAPEQIAGGAITTAIDVYALGVVLHELLCERRPERLSDGVLVRPSEASGRRHLRGDLDCILMRALQLDPAQRYSDAEALREDLVRHLDGHPVRARPESRLYRASRFVGRNRTSVAIAAVAALALVGATAFSIGQARVAQEQSRQAVRAKNFMVELLNALGPQADRGGPDLTVTDLLDIAVAKGETDLTDVPVARAELLATTALTLGDFGQPEKGLAIVERALATLGDAAPPLARAYLISAQANFVEKQGDFDRAERLAKEALALFDAAGASNTSSVLTQIYPRSVLAALANRRSDFRTAFELRKRNADEAKAKGEDPVNIAYTLRTLSLAYGNLGQDREAEAALNEALAIAGSKLPPDHHVMRELRAHVARVWGRQGRYAESERALREWIGYLEGRAKVEPVLLGAAQRALGNVYLKLGRADDADRAYDAALRVFGATNADFRFSIALGHGRAALLRGDFAAARANFAQAGELARRVFEPGHPNIAIADAGSAYAAQDDARLDASIATLVAREGVQLELVAEAFDWQSRLREQRGRKRGALDAAQRVRATLEKRYGPEHPETRAAAARVAALAPGEQPVQ